MINIHILITVAQLLCSIWNQNIHSVGSSTYSLCTHKIFKRLRYIWVKHSISLNFAKVQEENWKSIQHNCQRLSKLSSPRWNRSLSHKSYLTDIKDDWACLVEIRNRYFLNIYLANGEENESVTEKNLTSDETYEIDTKPATERNLQGPPYILGCFFNALIFGHLSEEILKQLCIKRKLHRLAVCWICRHFGNSESNHYWLTILGLKILILKHWRSKLEIYGISTTFEKIEM